MTMLEEPSSNMEDYPSAPVARLNQALDGRYRIERELGEGGMATVYLADDGRHGRHVALKVLKPELAALLGAERFLAEIGTTARLQHPHILPLFDSGEADGSLFYVMPYVEGETLRDRIDRERQLPIEEGLRIATGVASALQAAHEAGIVHRDIKPANILLSRGEPLVADFGIALAVGAARGTRLTEAGLSIGTPHYMSPEQATGDQYLGPSSDIFSLACVLYEMLVGEPPFTGKTAQASLGRLLQGALVAPMSARRSIPPHVDAALRKALETLPADRFTSARDFARALADPSFRHGEVVGAPVADRRWRLGALALGMTTVALTLLSAWALTTTGIPPQTLRLSVLLPEPQTGGYGTMALSRDGSILVYEGPSAEGSHQLWVRRWSDLNASPLPGTTTGLHPSFSPDGQEIAYMDRGGRQSHDNRLMITSPDGGVPRVLLAPIRGYPYWGRDGFIYHMDVETGGISRILARGGAVERITERQEGDDGPHFSPYPVPEGDAILFVVEVGDGWHVRAANLTSGAVHTLVTAGVRPHYASSGHLLYVTPSGELTAAPFDARAMKLTGPGVPVLRGVAFNRIYTPLVVAENGTLVYTTASSSRRYQAVWVDRGGAATVIDPDWGFDPGRTPGLALSPDGTQLAVSIMSDVTEDVWVKQLPRGPLTRLTAGPVQETRPRWTHDGRVTYVSIREGPGALYARAADGTGGADLLMSHERQIQEGILSGDGEWLIARVGSRISVRGAPPGLDVLGMRRGVDTAATPLIATRFDERAIALSPDGRWLAYESDETGRSEVYVRPFPDVDTGKRTVSVNGGVMPVWSRSGDALFYVNAANEMMEAQLATGPSLVLPDPKSLFQIGSEYLVGQRADYALYDVSPDDGRFLMLRVQEMETRELILVLNWLEELKGRVRD
jgi:eukaryotic-like serine/threonine-protein kinase